MDGGGQPKRTREFPWCCTILARTLGVLTALSKLISLCGYLAVQYLFNSHVQSIFGFEIY